jgi:hypothetical protein
MRELAPIVLFTYNRPIHTKKVLDALSLNLESKRSILYIFCDGPKENASNTNIENINAVRALAKNENRFLKIVVVEQPENKGLANSIIDGVSLVLKDFNTIIVLEDDILPSLGFLEYMNEALYLYENENNVGCIHAWNYNLDNSDYSESTFFIRGADCWGWATWRRSWKLFNSNSKSLLREVKSRNLEYEFDKRGTYEFTKMLQSQIDGKIDSWAIRWYASMFLEGKYCLQPVRSIVRNIGLDNTGVHCGTFDIQQCPVDFIDLKRIEIKEVDWFFNAYVKWEKENQVHISQRQKMRTIVGYLFGFFRKIFVLSWTICLF